LKIPLFLYLDEWLIEQVWATAQPVNKFLTRWLPWGSRVNRQHARLSTPWVLEAKTAHFSNLALNKITFERTRSLSNALYISPSKHSYRHRRIHPVTVTGSRPLMGHCVYESVVLLALKLCVKFEWSIVKHCENI